jgi:hypothetical protein
MPSDRHVIAGVEHIATTNPSTPDAPIVKPLDEMADSSGKTEDKRQSTGGEADRSAAVEFLSQ